MKTRIFFHGSSNKFGKFESKKIGTGEGYHSYGRGIYFAENLTVAKFYGKVIYKVAIPESVIKKSLDYDYNLSQQPPVVKKVLEPVWNRLPQSKKYPDPAGKYIFSALGGEFNGTNTTVTHKLLTMGLEGVWYFDAGSRDRKKGTHNLVVFPGLEHKVEILERDGQPVTAEYLSVLARLEQDEE
jgi:hypothetical protein